MGRWDPSYMEGRHRPPLTRFAQISHPSLLSQRGVLLLMAGRDSCGLTVNSKLQLQAGPLQLHACQDLIKFILFRPLEATNHLLFAPEGKLGVGG